MCFASCWIARLICFSTARTLNPNLRIVARVNDPAWYDRICRAGAHSALSPYDSYGIALAASALDASVVGVQDLPTLGLRAEEFTVLAGSPVVGTLLQDLAVAHPDVLVVGMRREQGITRWHEIPGPITVNDVIVILGEPSAMARQLMQSGTRPEESWPVRKVTAWLTSR